MATPGGAGDCRVPKIACRRVSLVQGNVALMHVRVTSPALSRLLPHMGVPRVGATRTERTMRHLQTPNPAVPIAAGAARSPGLF